MKIIFVTLFSLSSILLHAAEDVSVQFEQTNVSPVIFNREILKVFILAVTAFFILNSVRIILTPGSGNVLNGIIRVIVGLFIMLGIMNLV